MTYRLDDPLMPDFIGHEEPESKEYTCDVCGEQTFFLYIDDSGKTVGCPNCIHLVCASDVLEEDNEY